MTCARHPDAAVSVVCDVEGCAECYVEDELHGEGFVLGPDLPPTERVWVEDSHKWINRKRPGDWSVRRRDGAP